MATILVYRTDGQRPFSEILLDSGEHVVITLDAGGMTIERLPERGHSRERLVRASADAMAWLCVAFQPDRGRVAPLDIIVNLVRAMPSAAVVREAFAQVLAKHGR